MFSRLLLILLFYIIYVYSLTDCDSYGENYCLNGNICDYGFKGLISVKSQNCELKCDCDLNSQTIKSCSVDYTYTDRNGDLGYPCRGTSFTKCYNLCQSNVKKCYVYVDYMGIKQSNDCKYK